METAAVGGLEDRDRPFIGVPSACESLLLGCIGEVLAGRAAGPARARVLTFWLRVRIPPLNLEYR